MSGESPRLLDPERVRTVFVLVAHPDDETLWAGGLLLSHRGWRLSAASLCRAEDPDRAPKFRRACAQLGARSVRMAGLDDGPEQRPLSPRLLASTVEALAPHDGFDLLITHSPRGEYTRHLRHEEVGAAVADLWRAGKLRPREVWMFAYEDAGRSRPPEAISGADLLLRLTGELFVTKYRLVTELYGFEPESWEARATPRIEAFWRFTRPEQIDALFALDRTSRGEGGEGR